MQESCVYGAGGAWRCRRLSSGKVFRGWSVLWWGTVRRAWRAMTAGMLISRRWIVLGSQARAEASARAGVWEKVGRSAGRGRDRASDTVLREALRRDVVEPGVFCAADAVPWRRVRGRWRASRPGSRPPLCWWRGRWAGGFRDVLEARPGALVGLLVARGWPACPGARRLVRQVGGSRRRAPRSRGGRRRCTRVTRRSGGCCPWVCGVWSGRVNPYAAGRPAAGERLDGLLRASGPIGARQDPPAGSGAGPGLVQCPADDLDVVGARAASRKRRGAARVPRASSPALPVPWSNHAVRGAVTEPLLEGSGPYPLFLRVDAHQSGVDVDHRRPVRPDTGGR